MNVMTLELFSTEDRRSGQRLIRARRGISIIEVLVSILVAMIGVFGVMVMIPFAVSQVEQGFDQETSLALGRNAASEYEVKGFNFTNRWELSKRTAPAALVNPGVATVRSYVIDPIGASDRFVNNGLFTGYFPFVYDEGAAGGTLAGQIEAQTASAIAGSIVSADKGILMERINLRSSVPASFTPGLARFHFSWQNDLQFRTPTRDDVAAFTSYPTPELAPPQQIFDVDGANPVRRQALGEMSYIVVAVPNDVIPNPAGYPISDPETGVGDYVQSFRNYFVVYKQRPLPSPLGAGVNQPYDRVYQVDTSPAGMNIDYSTAPQFTGRIAYAGGSMVLRQSVSSFLVDSNGFSTQRSAIRRGDWIALTNVAFNPTRQRFFQQINFYQVLEATEDPATPGDWFVSLQGPDFDFLVATDNTGAPDPNINPSGFRAFSAAVDTTAGTTLPSLTYAIHLPDVWAVFERTTSN